MNTKILSIQGLRAIAALMIIFSHRGGYLPPLLNYELGANGVSIFIMLSGFVAYYSHNNDYSKVPSLKYTLQYTYKKIKKFYPLHFVTFVCVIPLEYLAVKLLLPEADLTCHLLEMAKRAAANLSLTHSFFPEQSYYFSYNQTSWYLSDTLFFCLLTPLIVYLICIIPKKLKKIGTVVNLIIFISCILIQLLIGLLLYNTEFAHAILYINPLYRIFDYIEGCIICFFFLKYKNKLNKAIINLLQIISVCCFTVFVLSWKHFPVGLAYCVVYTIPTAFLLFSLAYDTGIISKILKIKVLQFLGEISFELFLIHLVVFRYFDVICNHLPPIHIAFHTIIPVCLAILVSAAIHFLPKQLLHTRHNS